MSLGYLRIVGIDHHRLRRAREQLVGMGHQVLVEGILAGHQRRQRFPPGPSRPAGLLAERGEGPRESHYDGGVESAHVDSKLEGVGRHDRRQFAAEESPLDLSALGRCVAGSVGRHVLLEAVRQPIADRLVDQLGRLTAAGENDGSKSLRDQACRNLAGSGQGRSAATWIFVDQRRIP